MSRKAQVDVTFCISITLGYESKKNHRCYTAYAYEGFDSFRDAVEACNADSLCFCIDTKTHEGGNQKPFRKTVNGYARRWRFYAVTAWVISYFISY